MRFCMLASGSRANCCFVEAGPCRFLIDAGLSARATEKRLLSLGVEPATISTIFITHEHSDHTAGVRVFSRRYRIPVFANSATSPFLVEPYGVEAFQTGESFEWSGVRVDPFLIPHDAAEPVGFRFEYRGLVLGYATDVGRVTPLVKYSLRKCHGLVLESNYDRQLLYDCQYPWQLKQRISSSQGHLSNDQSATLLRGIAHEGLQAVVLAHLSENSNTPELALLAAKESCRGMRRVDITCGSFGAITGVFSLSHEAVGYCSRYKEKNTSDLDSLPFSG